MKLLYRLSFCLSVNVFLFYIAIQIWYFSINRVPHHNGETMSLQRTDGGLEGTLFHHKNSEDVLDTINVAVVCCGADRIQETLTMIKSAIVFGTDIGALGVGTFTGGANGNAFMNRPRLRAIVFTESNLMQTFDEKLSEWSVITNHSFTYDLHRVYFPGETRAFESAKDQHNRTRTPNSRYSHNGNWRSLFKPCASQRLFFPSLLHSVESILYVDTDVLFVSPLKEIWNHLYKMNSTQLAALAPEHEDPNTGWYNRFSKHPYYGQLGVNSGVMLMNLTRMRQFNWESYLNPILMEYRLKITWGDQDIINIIFHYHPERLYIYDCSYNYRPDHCMYTDVCKATALDSKDPEGQLNGGGGIRVVHGSRGAFHSERHPPFKILYGNFQKFQIGSDPYDDLLTPVEAAMQALSTDGVTNCAKLWPLFTRRMRRYLEESRNDAASSTF